MTDAPQGSPRPISTREDATAVVKSLRDAGHVAYFAGGCVRDELLGLKPKDYDVATDAPPQRVRKIFSNTQAVGAKFGVILVRHGQSQIEVATFRKEGKYEDGRHPGEVTFTTAEEDAKRRDFTINGMFFDPIELDVIDYVGGQEDLNAKILRAIGDPNRRFEEDHLRLLRAIRFAARFGLRLEQETETALSKHARQLQLISPERVAEELRLMLAPPTRTQAWKLLHAHRLDDVIFRFVALPWPQPHPEVSGRREELILDGIAPQSEFPFGPMLAVVTIEYVARLLPDHSEWRRLYSEMTVRHVVRALRKSLKISNEETSALEETLYGLELLVRPGSHGVAELKRFLARPTARYWRAILAAFPEEMIAQEHRANIDRLLHDYENTDYAPAPLITGDDLTARGLAPGPIFKRILNEVYDAQLESRILTKDQAMEMALRLAAGAAQVER